MDKTKSILIDLFKEGDTFRDPNDPVNSAYYNAKRGIENQAFVKWCTEFGGEVLLGDMEQSLIGKIIGCVIHPRTTEVERNVNLALLDDIMRDARFIDRIRQAFVEEEQRKQ